ncbi:MAG: GNAT family N-acetyltransferase [Saprospiraceae bacterium]
MTLSIHQIEFASPEYDEAVRLRYAILRQPLGLDFSAEQLAAEYAQLHLAAYDAAGRLVGYLNLTPIDEQTMQMRQVAIAAGQQGQGIGTELVAHSEGLAKRLGIRRFILHARETAVHFYERLDYHVFGEPYEEVTIPHRNMEKNLAHTS